MIKVFKDVFFWTTISLAIALFLLGSLTFSNYQTDSLEYVEVTSDEVLANVLDWEPQESIMEVNSYIKEVDAAFAVEIVALYYKSYLPYCENTATVTYNAEKDEWVVILDIKNSEDIYRIGINANNGNINGFVKFRY